MKRLLLLSIAVTLNVGLVLAAESKANSLTRQEISEGWVLLFDGETTFGWARRGDSKWSVQDGTLSYQPGTGGGYLSTTSEFADYQLHVEFWIDDQANSGVFLRCPTRGEITSLNAYEVNIYDPHDKWPTGSINEVAKTTVLQKTTGRWNTYDITAKGDHLVVKLNDQTTVDVRDSKHARGTIGLQNLKGEGLVRFRNLKLRPLDLTSAEMPAGQP